MAKIKPTVIIVRNERVVTNLGLQNNVIIVNAKYGQVIIPTRCIIPNSTFSAYNIT